MSRYLVDQLAARSNIGVLHRTEVVAAHGDDALTAIDVRNADTGETARLESAASSSSSAPTRRTSWLPPEIALDRRGYVLTGSDVTAADRWERTATRTCSRPAFPASSRPATSASAPSARRRCGRRRQHGDRVRAPVPQGRRRDAVIRLVVLPLVLLAAAPFESLI